MKLTDFNPRWLGHVHREKVGVAFDCPCGCGHGVIVTFDNPEDGRGPAFSNMPTMHREGKIFADLTLSREINRADSCGWRGYIEDGKIIKAR